MPGMNSVSQEVAGWLEKHTYYGLHSAVAKATTATPSSVAGWASAEVEISERWWPALERFFHVPSGHLHRIHDGEVPVGEVESNITNGPFRVGRPPADAQPEVDVSVLLQQVLEQSSRTNAAVERLQTEVAALRREMTAPAALPAPKRPRRPGA